MPRIEFAPTNRVQTTNFDYPKLKLKNGERARVLVGLESPVTEFVHNLNVPSIVDGIPQTGTEKRKDGTEYQAYKKNFISKPLCLGEYETLDKQGSDEKNCPMCAYAKRFPDRIKAPQRRYAMHVIRYKTQSGSFKPTKPFSVDLVVWGFTDKVFNQIIDLSEEWNLKTHDLNLGPCTGETFQKFDINVAADAAWQTSEEAKALVLETYKNNQIPDLTIACGNRKERRWIDIDLEKIQEAWTQIEAWETTHGKPGSTGPSVAPSASTAAAGTAVAATGGTDLSEDLSSLLDSGDLEETTVAAVSSGAAADSTDDLLGGSDEPAAVEADKPAEEEKPADAADFDDLLDGLDV